VEVLMIIKILLAVSLIMLFLLSSCSSLPRFVIPNERKISNWGTLDTQTADLLQGILDDAISKYNLIGIQASIKTKDGRTWNGASGTADKKRKKLLTINDPIRIGSVTKTFTAVLILHLIEKGYIRLDQNLDVWVPDISESHKITLRHLLNHSSGIPEILGMKVMMASTIHPHKIWKSEELLEIIKNKKLDFMPGSKHKYSNSNYILLGLIAEKVTGKPLKELYREEILNPLDLRNTFFVPYENPPINLVSGYDQSLIPSPGYIQIKSDNTSWSTCAYASGAMVSTANDLLKFISSIVDTTIINNKSLELMTSFHQGADKKEKYNKYFGFGLFHFDTVYDNTYGHLGLFIGSESIVLYHPEKKYIVSLIGNVSKFNKDELIKDIIRIIEQ